VAGVRIQHPVARSCRFTVVEGDRPYRKPYQCTPPDLGGCGKIHVFKAHHLNLDDTGAVIIGDELYKKLANLLEVNGFRVVNEVVKPPTMGIGLGPQVDGRGQWGDISIVEGVMNRG